MTSRLWKQTYLLKKSKYQLQDDGPVYGPIVGEGNQITQNFYNPGDALTCPPPPKWVCNIPYPPNLYFTGRKNLHSF